MLEIKNHGFMLIDTKSEEFRHQAEVRQIIKWRMQDRNKAMEYLQDVAKKRGQDSADRLRKDSAEQWDRKNRGLQGDWK